MSLAQICNELRRIPKDKWSYISVGRPPHGDCIESGRCSALYNAENVGMKQTSVRIACHVTYHTWHREESDFNAGGYVTENTENYVLTLFSTLQKPIFLKEEGTCCRQAKGPLQRLYEDYLEKKVLPFIESKQQNKRRRREVLAEKSNKVKCKRIIDKALEILR